MLWFLVCMFKKNGNKRARHCCWPSCTGFLSSFFFSRILSMPPSSLQSWAFRSKNYVYVTVFFCAIFLFVSCNLRINCHFINPIGWPLALQAPILLRGPRESVIPLECLSLTFSCYATHPSQSVYCVQVLPPAPLSKCSHIEALKKTLSSVHKSVSHCVKFAPITLLRGAGRLARDPDKTLTQYFHWTWILYHSDRKRRQWVLVVFSFWHSLEQSVSAGLSLTL